MLHFLALAVAAVAQEEQCDAATLEDQLFVAHWSHVPKAGGTAFADLAKRIVCAKNARFGPGETTMGFEKLNPCCVPNFCADARTCMATATTCPLVLGIGRHETSMSRLVDIPCCAQEWYSGTVASFLMYALKPSNPDHPTDAELAAAGVDRAGDVITLRPVDELKLGWKARALRGHYAWPLERRVAFFARTGVPRADLERRIRLKFPDDERATKLLEIAETAGPGIRRPEAMETCHRAAHGTWPDAAAAYSAYPDALPAAVAKVARPCCSQRSPGSASMTMLREPFRRAASAFHYGGHNPNQDYIYALRPGVFHKRGCASGRGRGCYGFEEFVALEEYSNVLTTFFGDYGCGKVQQCLSHAARPAGARSRSLERGCSLVAICHSYRNATLTRASVARAKAALDDHAFVGLTEAYTTSVKLLLATFGVTPQKSDFRVQRGQTACHRVAVLRLDAAKCRAAYASNRLDYELYEHAHRAFCTRLAAAGLRDDPDVVAELAAAELCGTLDFTDAAAVCGRLETPAADAKREKLRAKCPNLLW